MAKLNFGKWSRKHDNGTKEKLAAVTVKHYVGKQLLCDFVCMEIAIYGLEDNKDLESRAKLEAMVRDRLSYRGTSYANDWEGDVDGNGYDDSESEAIRAKAREIIDRLFPELESESWID